MSFKENNKPSSLSSKSSLIFSIPSATTRNSALLLSVRTLKKAKVVTI